MPVDISRALDLRLKHGLPYSEIGAIEGVSKQRIHQLLKPLIPEPTLIQQFKAHQSDIIHYGQFKAMKAYLSLDDDEQKEMIKRRGLVDFGIGYDKGRLQDDLSTANLASLTADIASVKRAKVVDNPGDRDDSTGK